MPQDASAPATGPAMARHGLDAPLPDEAAVPAIAIVIAARNMAPFIAATLESALDGVSPSREIVVVDDGSTDGTRAIADSYRNRDPRVSILHRSGGDGVSAARNAGLAATRAPTVLFLDADDLLASDALTRLHAGLAASPASPAAFGDLVLMTEDGQTIAPRSATIDIKPRRDTLAALVAKNMIVNGGTILIRRAAIAQVGPFAAGIAYGEDWEFWCRLATLGDFAVVDGPPVLRWRQRARGANNIHRAMPLDRSIAALDRVIANPHIQAQLGVRRLNSLARQRRIDLYWASARQELMFGSKAKFLAVAARGALRYPDSLLRPRLVLRFLGSLTQLLKSQTKRP